MKNFIYFIFLSLTLSLGSFMAKAAPTCTSLSVVTAGSQIVDLGGGSYAYRINIKNTGPSLGPSTTLNISIATTQFTCANVTQALPGSIAGITTAVDFPLTSPIEDISTSPPAFGAIPTITVGGANPSPFCDITNAVIINTSTWGCTNPASLNYDASATFDNNSCIDDVCEYLEILQITIGNTPDGVRLLLSLKNNGPYTLNSSTYTTSNIAPFLTSIPAAFSPANGAVEDLDIAPGAIQTVAFGIAGGLSSLTDSILTLNGSFQVNVAPLSTPCHINLTNYEVDITHLGCQDVSAFNYDQYATVDNGTCIQDISVSQTIVQPLCDGDPGSATLNILGGTSNAGGNYIINTYGQDINNLLPGTYVFTVKDYTSPSIGGPIEKNIEVIIEEPQDYSVTISMITGSTMQAELNVSSFTGWYYWLLDGVVIDSNQTGQFTYSTPGIYTCYVQSPVNALDQQCYAYSNNIVLTEVGTEEYEDNGISLYPNPNNGSFNIVFEEDYDNIIIAEIFDIQGRKVFEYKADNFDGNLFIDNIGLTEGLYHIRMENNNKLYRTQLVVQ